jgi:uncharacterized protein (TIGR02328 family)
MRLWHYKLLPFLPDKFIIAEWRECIAIKRQWEKGTLKHRLVKYVTNYHRGCFIYYVDLVVEEMKNRNIKFNFDLYNEIYEFCKPDLLKTFDNYLEHNDRYLKQCYYNLQEKADRGIITTQEWKKINKNIGVE